MGPVEEILSLAKRSGVALWTEAEQLRFRAPAGAMTAELRTALSTRKTDIIAALGRPVLVRKPLSQRLPIIEYHRSRWDNIRSGFLGIEFVNSPHAAVSIPGELIVSALRRALCIVAARHPILRARVVETVDGLEFALSPEDDIPLEVIDLSNEAVAQRQAVARIVVTERIWRPFEADARHWLRLFAVRLGETEHVVGFVIHHFIADAGSVGIFLQELLHAYAAFASGVAPGLPDLPCQYFDYISGMNQWIRSAAARISGSYWREYLRNAPATRIPPDFEVDPEALGLLATQSARTSAEAVVDVQSFCRSSGMTLHAVVAAAFIGVMAHQSKAQDIVLVTRTHGRTDPALLPMIGAFFDAMALRAFVTLEMSFHALATRVWNDLTRASLHQNYPYHLVVPALAEIGASNIAPMMNFLDQPAAKATAAAGHVQSFELAPRPPIQHPAKRYGGFYTQIAARTDGIYCKAEYMDIMYREATVTNFVQAICRLLERGARDPARSLSDLLAD